MALKVKKYLKFNGVEYKPGAVIEKYTDVEKAQLLKLDAVTDEAAENEAGKQTPPPPPPPVNPDDKNPGAGEQGTQGADDGTGGLNVNLGDDDEREKKIKAMTLTEKRKALQQLKIQYTNKDSDEELAVKLIASDFERKAE